MLATFVGTTLFRLEQGVMFLVSGGDINSHCRRIMCRSTISHGWRAGGFGVCQELVGEREKKGE